MESWTVTYWMEVVWRVFVVVCSVVPLAAEMGDPEGERGRMGMPDGPRLGWGVPDGMRVGRGVPGMVGLKGGMPEAVVPGAGEAVGELFPVSVAVTGQIVVYRSMVTVVTWGPAGQLVTVGAQDRTVITEVVRTVEVVY